MNGAPGKTQLSCWRLSGSGRGRRRERGWSRRF